MLTFSLSFFWVIIILIAIFAFAIYVYSNTNFAITTPKKWLLILLRTFGLFFLLFAILDPVIKNKVAHSQKPHIAIGFDNSQSMNLKGISGNSRLKEEKILADFFVKHELNNELVYNIFSDSIHSLKAEDISANLTAKGLATDVSLPINFIADSINSKNIVGNILVTDGNYNRGANPIYEAEKFGLPVYVIGLGDTIEPNDASIQSIFTNDIAYTNSVIPIDVTYKTITTNPHENLVLSLFIDGIKLSDKNIVAQEGAIEQTHSFTFSPNKEGIIKITAKISELGNETNRKNNEKSIFVKVKSGKRKVVIIASSPSPDLAFLKKIIEEDQNKIPLVLTQKPDGSFIEGKLATEKLVGSEAIILLGFPSEYSTNQSIKLLKDLIAKGSYPLYFFAQSNTDFTKLKEFEDLLPVKFSQPQYNEMKVFAALTTKGKDNPATRTNSNDWEQLPPISKTETMATPKPESEVLATIKLGNAILDEPLIVSRKIGNFRCLAFLGYGFYLWQLNLDAKLESRGEKPLQILKDFINNSVNWVAVQEDKKQFKVTTNKQVYELDEVVQLNAQVYDDSYKPLSNAVIRGVARNNSGKSIDINFTETGNGIYESSLANLPVGDYTVSSKANYNSKLIGEDICRFSVEDISVEMQGYAMNIDLVKNLAQKTGGKFYNFREAKNVFNDIKNAKNFVAQTTETETKENLWDNWKLLFLALLCFALEWTIRKFSGLV